MTKKQSYESYIDQRKAAKSNIYYMTRAKDHLVRKKNMQRHLPKKQCYGPQNIVQY